MTELSPEAKKLFEASRAALAPSQARLAKVGAAIAAQVAGTTSAGAAPGGAAGKLGAAKGLAGMSSTKIVGVVVVAVAGAAAVVQLSGRDDTSAAAELSRSEGPAAIGPTAGDGAKEPAPAHTRAPEKAPAKGTAVAPLRLDELERASNPAAAPEASQRSPVPSSAPPTPGEKVVLDEEEPTRPTERSEEATREPEQPAKTSPPVAKEPARVPAAADTTDTLLSEVRLVRGARSALDGGDASRALALLDQHAERHPRGALVEERLALRVLALCAVGRTSEARAAAERFARAAPQSPHLSRIRVSCAGPVR